MKFCTNCGQRLEGQGKFCPHCGCQMDYRSPYEPIGPEVSGVAHNPGLVLAAKIFMILAIASAVSLGISYFIQGFSDSRRWINAVVQLTPLAWSIPMTIYYAKTVKSGDDVSVGFKVCTLIFVNLIAGILMLVDKKRG